LETQLSPIKLAGVPCLKQRQLEHDATHYGTNATISTPAIAMLLNTLNAQVAAGSIGSMR